MSALRAEHKKALSGKDKSSKQTDDKIKKAENKVKELEQELEEAHKATDAETAKAKKAGTESAEATKAKDSTQSELDDLLMVFGDLEEKVAKYKVSLATFFSLLVFHANTYRRLSCASLVRKYQTERMMARTMMRKVATRTVLTRGKHRVQESFADSVDIPRYLRTCPPFPIANV